MGHRFQGNLSLQGHGIGSVPAQYCTEHSGADKDCGGASNAD
jgi:hypothetical protein